MTVKRLRPLPSAEQLAAMYPTPHDHRLWGQGHHDRVEATIALAIDTLSGPERSSVADLSCGNGEIARRVYDGPRTVDGAYPLLYLGDLAALDTRLPGYKLCGPVEETLQLIAPVAAFVCSETIEHLDEPGKVLALARTKAVALILSTPLDCWEDTNAEHLWAWDQDGVEDLCARAGWRPQAFRRLPTEVYTYGIWVMS